MKQFTKQKWVLSALLITALGSQYYFSTSSVQVSSVEMASTATVDSITENAQILAAVVAPQNPSVPSVPVAPSVPPAPVATTEGVAPTVPCADCVILSRENAAKIHKILQDIIDSRAAAATPEVAATPVETPLEKSRRLREEAAETRRLAAEEKAAKIREDKLMRNDEFKDKMEQAADRCAGDVSCISSRYTSLLSRYSGTRKVDQSVAAAAYARYIQPGLKAAVGADGNDALAQETLQNISMDIPLEYRAIKEASINDIKAVAQERALAANQDFRLADQYGKDKKYTESNQAFQQATVEARDFQSDMTLYQNAIREGASDDAATLAYMQRNFMPEIARLYGNMNNLNGLNMATSDDPNSPAASANRSARGGTPINPASVDNGKMTTLPNTVNTANPGSVTFGTPTNTQTGSRTRGQ